MAEFKTQKSSFAEYEKDIVEEWLSHPCMSRFIKILEDSVKETREIVIQIATLSEVLDVGLPGKITSAGTVIMTLERVLDLIKEADSYAKSV
jgi:hypothetical protein